MERFLYYLQTAMLAVGAGIASAFTAMIFAAFLSLCVFFGLSVYYSVSMGVGMYFSNVVPMFYTSWGFFKIAASIGAFIGLFVGAAKVISERSR